jgi:hypothetical protein
MKIIEGIKLQGKPAEIPDCSRDDLPEFFKEMGYKVGAEIGVYKGKYTKVLAKSGLQIYGIDPWRAYGDVGVISQDQKELDFYYKNAQQLLAPYSNVIIIRKASMEALKDFKDESLDFVYIDGNHHFKYITEDICEWTNKVRRGGVVSGHDYYFFANTRLGGHVPYVVEAYTRAYGIKNWYVLGRKDYRKGEKRDTYRSWLWFKK